MGDTYISSPAGTRVPPHPNCAHPKQTQTAVQLTNGTKDTNTEQTVTAGATYLVTAMITGGFYLGFADVTTAANVRYAVPLYASGAIIKIPDDVTVLHYATNVNSGIAYLIELDMGD